MEAYIIVVICCQAHLMPGITPVLVKRQRIETKTLDRIRLCMAYLAAIQTHSLTYKAENIHNTCIASINIILQYFNSAQSQCVAVMTREFTYISSWFHLCHLDRVSLSAWRLTWKKQCRGHSNNRRRPLVMYANNIYICRKYVFQWHFTIQNLRWKIHFLWISTKIIICMQHVKHRHWQA